MYKNVCPSLNGKHSYKQNEYKQCMYMYIRVVSINELLVEYEKIVYIMQLGQHGVPVYPSQNNSTLLQFTFMCHETGNNYLPFLYYFLFPYK